MAPATPNRPVMTMTSHSRCELKAKTMTAQSSKVLKSREAKTRRLLGGVGGVAAAAGSDMRAGWEGESGPFRAQGRELGNANRAAPAGGAENTPIDALERGPEAEKHALGHGFQREWE